MVSENEVEQSTPRPDGTERPAQADHRTHLIHRPAKDTFPPAGRTQLLLVYDVSSFLLANRLSCWSGWGLLPAEFCAINPHAMHDHRKSAGQSHDSFSHTAPSGYIHGPGFQP